jgi:hypothetical protein
MTKIISRARRHIPTTSEATINYQQANKMLPPSREFV